MSNCSDAAPWPSGLPPPAHKHTHMAFAFGGEEEVGDAYTCVAAGHGRCRHLMIHLSGLRPHNAHIHLAWPSRLYPSPPYRAKFIVLRSNWPACADTDGAPLLRPPDETRSPFNGQPCERQRHRTARKSEWNGTLLAWHLLRPSVSMAVEAAAASEHVPTHSHTLYTHTSTLPFLSGERSFRRPFETPLAPLLVSSIPSSRCDYASIVVYLRTPGLHSALRGWALLARLGSIHAW